MNKLIHLFSVIVMIVMVNSTSVSAYVYSGVVDQILSKMGQSQDTMTATDFNTTGMYFYKKKLYEAAALMFFRATELDEKHMLANYNLACVLSLQLHETFQPMLNDIKQIDRIFYYLHVSMQNRERMEKAMRDSDLENIKKENPRLFDAITYPKDRRFGYAPIFTYKNAYRVEDEIWILFVDGKGEEQMFSSDQEKLKPFNFYVTDESMLPIVSANTALIGKQYRITLVDSVKVSEENPSVSVIKNITSIKEINE